jgi:putative CocE/NonD family hydrolase
VSTIRWTDAADPTSFRWHHGGTRIPAAEFAGTRFGPASLVDIQQLHVEWYRWVLQGGPKPDFLKKQVAYYVTGAEKWRYASTLDAVTSHTRTLYLGSTGNASQVFSAGTLTEDAVDSAADGYIYDPCDPTSADLETASEDPLCLRPTFPSDNLRDQKPLYGNEGKLLIYHSAAFSEETELSGFFRLSAWIAIDQPDTDFVAAVYEVDPEGRSTLLTSDVVRARYREGLREEKLIRTTGPLRYDFHTFTFTSRLVAKGSRLRLVIGPFASIYGQRNFNSGRPISQESKEDARPVTVRLCHDAQHPSALAIPIAQAETDDA